MNKRYERFAELGIVCSELTVDEAAIVVDQTIEKCLKCPVLQNFDPKTPLTVDRLSQLAYEDDHYPTKHRCSVLIVGKRTLDLDVCALATSSFETNKKIDLLTLIIPQRFVEGR